MACIFITFWAGIFKACCETESKTKSVVHEQIQGGVQVSLTKKSSDVFFFAFFLVLSLFYRSQMVNFNPAPPLWIRTSGFRLFRQATILIHRRLTCISFLTGLYLECGYEDLRCLCN